MRERERERERERMDMILVAIASRATKESRVSVTAKPRRAKTLRPPRRAHEHSISLNTIVLGKMKLEIFLWNGLNELQI